MRSGKCCVWAVALVYLFLPVIWALTHPLICVSVRMLGHSLYCLGFVGHFLESKLSFALKIIPSPLANSSAVFTCIVQAISFLSFEFSRHAGGEIPLLFKGELQFVLTRVPSQTAYHRGCDGKGFRDICGF